MTQMLLFDSPGAKETMVSLTQTNPADQTPRLDQGEETNVAAQLEHDSGLHHMGDLARLVLLRYELVARRRARLAARKAR